MGILRHWEAIFMHPTLSSMNGVSLIYYYEICYSKNPGITLQQINLCLIIDHVMFNVDPCWDTQVSTAVNAMSEHSNTTKARC